MNATYGDADQGLTQRIDELQSRVDQIEAVLFDESDLAAVNVMSPSTAEPSAAEPMAPEPSTPEVATTKDLRTLQAEATADLAEPIPATPPPASGPLVDMRFIEEQIAGRALALIGGAALLLGAVFFLSLAFSRGWIGPGMQVTLGVVGGAIGLMVGAVLLNRGDRLVGHVLTAVGLTVISLSLFAASTLYELIEPSVALAGTFAAVAATTAIAVRTSSQIIAAFGLVALLAAPPVMGAEPEPATLIYMLAALTGVSVLSLWQTWAWLPPIAFVLSVPQLYRWIETGPEPMLGVAVLLLYWALMTLAAGGEAFRRPGRELSFTSAPLFLAVGASVIGLGFLIIEADPSRAAYLFTLAALHGAVAGFFMVRRGEVDPFGLLAGAYGIAIASAAVPLVMGAPLTAVIWASEAGVLAFFAGRRAHGPSLITALILYAVAATQLALQLLRAGAPGLFDEASPVASSDALLVGFVLFVGIGVAMLVAVPSRTVRLLVVGIASIVALPAVLVAFSSVAAVAGWGTVAVAAAASPLWLRLLPERSVRWHLGPALDWIRPERDLGKEASMLPMGAAALAMLLATARTVAEVFAQPSMPDVPFTDAAGLSALILAAGYIALGMVMGHTRIGVIVGGLVIGIVGIVEMPFPWTVVLWGGLAVAAAALSTRDAGGRVMTFRHASIACLAVAGLFVLALAPPDRLVVQPGGVEPHLLLVSQASFVIGVLALALGASAWLMRTGALRVAGVLAAIAGAAVAYLLSIGVVDVFAGEAHALARSDWQRLEVLAKEGQVALSVLWTALGVAVLAIGLVRRSAPLRLAGLTVLALATLKVFLFDLSSLDVAYRVISLMVLGSLLVGSAYAWTRMRPAAGQTGSSEAPERP